MDSNDDLPYGHTPAGQNFPNTQDLGGPTRPSARARSGNLFFNASPPPTQGTHGDSKPSATVTPPPAAPAPPPPPHAPPAEAAAELDDNEADALLFAQCDHGDQLLTQVSGAQFGAALSSLLLAICSTITCDRFAKSYTEWHKAIHHSIIAFFYTFKTKCSDAYTMIMECTKLSGSACRQKISQTITFILSVFSADKVHDIFVYGLIIYCWGEESSTQSALILLTIHNYLLTAHDMTETFISNCSSFAFSGTPITGPVQDTPGYRRLNWKTNIRGVTKAWRDLLRCCAQCLILSRPEHTAKEILETVSLQPGDHNHELNQHKDESVSLFVARHVAAYTDAQLAMDGLGPSHARRLPDDFLRAEFLINGCLPHLRNQLNRIFVHDLKITEDELNFNAVIEGLTLAETRHRQSFSALQNPAFRAKNQDKDKEKDKDKDKDNGKGKDKPKGKPSKRDDREAKPQTTPDANGHRYLPFPASFFPIDDKEKAQKLLDNWRENGKCSNCGNQSPLYPPHLAKNCPYERRDKKPWKKNEPVQPLAAPSTSNISHPTIESQPPHEPHPPPSTTPDSPVSGCPPAGAGYAPVDSAIHDPVCGWVATGTTSQPAPRTGNVDMRAAARAAAGAAQPNHGMTSFSVILDTPPTSTTLGGVPPMTPTLGGVPPTAPTLGGVPPTTPTLGEYILDASTEIPSNPLDMWIWTTGVKAGLLVASYFLPTSITTSRPMWWTSGYVWACPKVSPNGEYYHVDSGDGKVFWPVERLIPLNDHKSYLQDKRSYLELPSTKARLAAAFGKPPIIAWSQSVPVIKADTQTSPPPPMAAAPASAQSSDIRMDAHIQSPLPEPANNFASFMSVIFCLVVSISNSVTSLSRDIPVHNLKTFVTSPTMRFIAVIIAAATVYTWVFDPIITVINVLIIFAVIVIPQVHRHGLPRHRYLLVLLAVITLICNTSAEPPTSGSFQSDEWAESLSLHRPPISMPASVDTSTRVGVYVAFVPDSSHPFTLTKARNIVVGPDSLSDLSIISKTAVDPTWERIPMSTSATGVGGRASFAEAVIVPIRMQWGATLDHIVAYVGNTPPGVDLVMGCDILKQYGASIDIDTQRVHFKTSKDVIHLRSISAVAASLNSPPLTFLATNSGCNFCYSTIRNLGLNVKKWYSVEINPTCREVTSQIVPPEHLHELEPHDVTELERKSSWARNTHIDVHIDTASCKPFSRLRKNPGGLAEPRAQSAIAAANLHAALRRKNPRIRKLVENVEFHHSLHDDKARLESLWCGTYTPVNAKHLGSPSSRPRNICTDIVDILSLDKIESVPTSHILDKAYTPTPWLPCIVATADTRNPPMAHPLIGSPRPLSPEEAERAQGWPTGISNGCLMPLHLTDEARLDMIGSALNSYHCFHIFQHLVTPGPPDTPVQFPAVVATLPHTPDQLESLFGSMSRNEMLQWMRNRCKGYTLPKLPLSIRKDHLPNAKLPRSTHYRIPSGLEEAVFYALQKQIDKGYMKEVTIHTGSLKALPK